MFCSLTPRTDCSYTLDGPPAALADWLCSHGFRRIPTRSPHEVARLRSAAGQLVVLYPACVLVQGQRIAETRSLLSELTIEQAVLL